MTVFPVEGWDMLTWSLNRVTAAVPNKKQNEIPHKSGDGAHKGVEQQREEEEEEDGWKGTVKNSSANIGMKRRRKALIPLLFQPRSVCNQEALDQGSVVGLSVYNYSTIS